MALEKDHEKAGNRYARLNGWTNYKIQFAGRRGATDRLYAHPAHGSFYVEWKRPGEEPTEQQRIRHTEMQDAGLKVLWFDCVEKFIGWIDSFEDTGL